MCFKLLQLKPYFILIPLAFLCNLTIAQNAFNITENSTDKQKEHALDSIVGHYDTYILKEEAYQAFESLKKAIGSKVSSKLQTKIDKSLFLLDKRYNNDNNFDQMRNRLFALNEICIRKKYYEIAADNYIQIAWIYRDEKKYGQMLNYYLKAYEIIKDLSFEDYPSKNYSLYVIAEGFYAYNDYSRAIEIVKASYMPDKKTSALTFSTTLIGMAYLKSQQYDSALVWFKATLNFSEKVNDTTWIGINSGNIGNVLRLQNKNEEAKPYLIKGINFASKGNVWDNVANFKIYLADIYLQQNENEKCFALLQEARPLITTLDEDNQFKIFTVLIAYYRKIGNANIAFEYQDSLEVLKNKKNIEFNNNLKVAAELTHEREKSMAHEELIKAKTNQQKWTRNFIIIGLFATLGIFYLVYKRKQQAIVFEKQVLQNKNEMAEQALETAKGDLHNFTNSIKDKNLLIAQFTEEIEKLQALPCNIITPEQAQTLDKLKASAILTDNDWETFTLSFNKVHPGFLQRLKLNLPDVSPAETRFFALLKLNLNNKEMATILNISSEAIRTTRFRLRKKMQLGDEESLENIVAQY